MTTNPSLVERLRARLQNEAAWRNSAYDRYGMENTPQSVDPDVFAAANRIEHLESLLRKIISEGQGGATAEELVLIAGRIDQ